MKSLTRLDLHGSGFPGASLGTRFTAEGLQHLKHLPRLRTLWLTNLRLDGGFRVLKELTQLRHLTLTMTDISESEVVALEESMTNTTIAAMSGGGRVARAQEDESRESQTRGIDLFLMSRSRRLLILAVALAPPVWLATRPAARRRAGRRRRIRA